MGERLAAMLEAALVEPEVPAGQARAILQEMATALEELRVAEEELTVQAEQLTAAAEVVDAERERYGELFEFAPDAYLETDAHGKILIANGAAERLLGVRSRFLVGKLLVSFLPASSVREFRALLADLPSREEPVTYDVEVTPRGGDPVPVELRVGAHVDLTSPCDGRVRVRWLLRDVTERLKLESELRQLHADVDLLQALADVNRLIESGGDPVEPMLDGLVELAARVAPDVEAGVMLADAHGG